MKHFLQFQIFLFLEFAHLVNVLEEQKQKKMLDINYNFTPEVHLETEFRVDIPLS